MASKPSDLAAFLRDFALGGVTQAVERTLTAPLERVKLVLQTQDANPRIRSGEVLRYKGIVDCCSRICREQGPRRLWDGNFAGCLSVYPNLFFGILFQDTFKKILPKYSPQTEFSRFFASNMASGVLAATCTMGIVYPLGYARTRLALDVGPGERVFSGVGSCLRKTAAGPGGLPALYTGFGVSIVGIASFLALQLGTFDTIMGLNPWKEDTGVLGAASTFAAANAATTWGAAATYPFDTVRCRLQLQAERPLLDHVYKGTADCFKRILVEEGAAGLYKGFLANLGRSIGWALAITFYDRAKAGLGR